MSSLSAADFPDFFTVVHGYPPFAWQQELPQRIIDAAIGTRPLSIAAAPGLGKTAIVDAWVFALALDSADGPESRRVPTRLAAMVNRQLVVDATARRAQTVAGALADPTDEIVAEVARRLEDMAAGMAALNVVSMHGAVQWRFNWAPEPAQPTVVCATPDQVVSRTLFSGYGTSAGMAPVDAALMGTDIMVVADEAHLSDTAVETLRTVATMQRASQVRPVRPMVVVSMTATPSPHDDADTDTLVAATHSDPTCDVRLDARRNVVAAQIKVRVPASSSDAARRAALREGFAARLADHARGMATAERLPTVGVIVNTVSVARAVHRQLGDRALLLVGPTRAADRSAVVDEMFAVASCRTTGDGRPFESDAPRFVVATQTVEVGVDLDVDGLVMELCPYPSIKQRLGRADRAGLRHASGHTTPVVIAHCSAIHSANDFPVYGAAGFDTKKVITDTSITFAGTSAARTYTGVAKTAVGVSWRDLASWEANLDTDLRAAISDAVDVLPLLRRHDMDTLAATSRVLRGRQLTHRPDVSAYIRDPGDQRVDVGLLWRCDLDDDGLDATRSLISAPADAAEQVTVSLVAARRWLARRQVDQVAVLPADGSVHVVKPLDDVGPNDLLVLPTTLGGCDRYGFDPDSIVEVTDVADIATGRLRTSADATDHLGLPPAPTGGEAGDLGLWLDEVAAHPNVQLAVVATDLARSSTVRVESSDLVDETGAPLLLAIAPTTSTASDDLTHTTATTLQDHSRHVARHAQRMAHEVGIDPLLVDTVRIAGLLHDAGKVDPLFQAYLRDGISPDAGDDPIAKSGMYTDRWRRHQARRRAGLPSGQYHETLSGPAASAWLRQRPDLDHLDGDLVRWLVATHHGGHRPVPATAPGLIAQDVSVDIDDTTATVERADWVAAQNGHGDAARYATLTDGYGHWGLAHLEALVRLADQRASAEGC